MVHISGMQKNVLLEKLENVIECGLRRLVTAGKFFVTLLSIFVWTLPRTHTSIQSRYIVVLVHNT